MINAILSTPTPIWLDPGWLQVIIGIAGIIIAVIVTFASVNYGIRKQQSKKEISYYTISDTELLSIREEIEGLIEIYIKGKQVKNLNLTIINIQNSGNTPINPEDFKTPLEIKFTEIRKILEADIIKTQPNDLTPILKIDQEKVTVEPLLINKKEWIEIKILTASNKGAVRVEGRISGTEIKQRSEQMGIIEKTLTVGGALGIVGLITMFIGFVQIPTRPTPPPLPTPPLVLTEMTTGAIILFIGIILVTITSIWTTAKRLKLFITEKRKAPN